MPADQAPGTPIWANIETMPSIAPRPGVTMYPATGTNMMINFVRIEAGAEVPLHQHPHEQGGTVIEGTILMTIDGETREMRAGDVYIAPPNSIHGAIGGPEGCLVVDIFSPPREDYRDAAG
ncbi:MAG TPA: cupin domain-containing protein [Thermomicrobiales bacterium]|jgi:quercetin dioxygenase-like cupin family protein|nr:cupin domain-containing protein [Thermomicrobiales bacterium]